MHVDIDIIGGIPLPACPSSCFTIPKDSQNLALVLHSPTTTSTFTLLSFLALGSGLYIITSYGPIRILNKMLRLEKIRMVWMGLWLVTMGMSFAIDAVRYASGLPYWHVDPPPLGMDEFDSIDPRQLESYLLLSSTLLRSASVWILSYALLHQYRFRSEYSVSPSPEDYFAVPPYQRRSFTDTDDDDYDEVEEVLENEVDDEGEDDEIIIVDKIDYYNHFQRKLAHILTSSSPEIIFFGLFLLRLLSIYLIVSPPLLLFLLPTPFWRVSFLSLHGHHERVDSRVFWGVSMFCGVLQWIPIWMLMVLNCFGGKKLKEGEEEVLRPLLGPSSSTTPISTGPSKSSKVLLFISIILMSIVWTIEPSHLSRLLTQFLNNQDPQTLCVFKFVSIPDLLNLVGGVSLYLAFRFTQREFFRARFQCVEGVVGYLNGVFGINVL